MLLLSYPLGIDVPVFPGTPPLEIRRFQNIDVDGSRSSTVEFNTHTGSHIDLPAHFHEEGRDVSMLPRLIELGPARCIDVPADGDVPLRLDDMPDDLGDVEVILLRTGYHRLRENEQGRYRDEHPWLHPEAAKRLLRLPGLRAIGMDVLSAASPNYPDEGGETHRLLLRPERPVMIMEDLDLSDESLPRKKWALHIIPLFTADVESTPITVLAAPL